jgi:hypothetical protein
MIFNYNPFRLSEDLLPSRSPSMIAWIRVLLRPLYRLTLDFQNNLINGITVPIYNNATSYNKGDRVRDNLNAVYELIATSSTGVAPSGSTLSAIRWRNIQQSYIGTTERSAYNGQIIVLTNLTNKHFNVTSAPFIWFSEINTSSYFPAVTVNFPLAVYNAQGNNIAARNSAIEGFLGKYVPAQFPILITTF